MNEQHEQTIVGLRKMNEILRERLEQGERDLELYIDWVEQRGLEGNQHTKMAAVNALTCNRPIMACDKTIAEAKKFQQIQNGPVDVLGCWYWLSENYPDIAMEYQDGDGDNR